jgi:hypothetical protein
VFEEGLTSLGEDTVARQVPTATPLRCTRTRPHEARFVKRIGIAFILLPESCNDVPAPNADSPPYEHVLCRRGTRAASHRFQQ